MKIVSYYTVGTPYEEVMNELLLPSVKKWGLDYDIQGIPNFGSWQANTGYKATFCRDMLLKHREAICFIDADGTIEQMPSLLYSLPKTVDIAFHLFNWMLHWRNKPEDTSNMHLLSGTLYLSYNSKVLSLCERWIETVSQNVNIWEQKILENLIKENPSLNIYHLPAEYCCVLKQDYTIPNYINDPKIIHWQRSRFYKRWNADKLDAERKIEKAKNYKYKP
jgi:hypothetical protein